MKMTTFRQPFFIAAATLLGAIWASPALADPCEAPLPRQGERFSGVVRYIGDGDGLCVGPADRPDRWIEIRLADFYAPELHERGGAEAKQRLAQLTLGKTITCRAGRRSYDRVIAACTLGRRPLGQLLRDTAASQAVADGDDDREQRTILLKA